MDRILKNFYRIHDNYRSNGIVSDEALDVAKEDFINSELELFSGANFLLISMGVAF